MMTPELLLGLNQRAGWVPLHVALRAVLLAREQSLARSQARAEQAEPDERKTA